MSEDTAGLLAVLAFVAVCVAVVIARNRMSR
jgi:hypothetical protein